MEIPICSGRDSFEEAMPFGSEKNKCPLGMETECEHCRLYKL